MNIKQDYSYLFSSFNNSNNNNNSFYGINLSDYASIKNGSYGKALKAYYKEQNSDDKNNVTNNNSESTNKTESSENIVVKQEILDIQKHNDELQSSANKLLQKGTSSLFKAEYKDADKEALYKAVSDFVSDFNTLSEKGSFSSFGSIARMSQRMEDTASDYKKALEGIGISLDKGKLSINKDSFMKADMEQVKELFNDRDSFGHFVSQRTESIESAVKNIASQNNIKLDAIKKEEQVSSDNKTENTTDKDDVRKQEMTNMQKYADELQSSANQLLQKGNASLFKAEYQAEDKEALYKTVSDFVSDFNTVLEKGTESTADAIVKMAGRLKDSADGYKASLAEIGISVEEKKLTIDKDSFMKADMEQVKKLFNETESFGYFVSQRAESIEYAANNEANRNNLYTENGTYNNASVGALYTEIV